MGITKNNAKFLFYSKRLGVSFENTLTLGRQFLYADKNAIQENINFFKNNTKTIHEVAFQDNYAEPFFHILGSTNIESIDYSDYEDATITHDLNNPIPDTLKNKFSVVVDGGTIEHVFNFPVAIKNCMEALKVGGHYIGFTPANNTTGHGFYQFSPEVYFRVFDKCNGFQVKLIATHVENTEDWYEIVDPAIIKNRVELVNSAPTHLIILAKKIESKEIFNTIPQQSDYVYNWEVNDAISKNVRYEKDSFFINLYRKLPLFIRKTVHTIYAIVYHRKTNVNGLGEVNPNYFKKIEINPS